MTRKLVHLDFGTLDRISGGCRPVAVEPTTNPGLAMRNKLRGLGAEIMSNGADMNITTLPASFADIRDVDLPPVLDLLPAEHDLMAQANAAAQEVEDLIETDDTLETNDDEADIDDDAQDMDDLFDMQGAGVDELTGNVPPSWCGTASNGSWEDCDLDEPEDATVDSAEADATDAPAWEPAIGTLVELDQSVAAPEVRDHRIQIMDVAADFGEPIVRDHRGAADTTASGVGSPVIRDQR